MSELAASAASTGAYFSGPQANDPLAESESGSALIGAESILTAFLGWSDDLEGMVRDLRSKFGKLSEQTRDPGWDDEGGQALRERDWVDAAFAVASLIKGAKLPVPHIAATGDRTIHFTWFSESGDRVVAEFKPNSCVVSQLGISGEDTFTEFESWRALATYVAALNFPAVLHG